MPPTFSSFPASAPPPVDNASLERTRENERRSKERRPEKRRKEKLIEGKRHARVDVARVENGGLRDHLEGAAFVDTAGDKTTSSYGQPASGLIPKYRRLGNRIVGLRAEGRIDFSRNQDQPGIQLKWGKEMDRAVQRVRLPDRPPPAKIRRITPRQHAGDFTANESFIALPRRVSTDTFERIRFGAEDSDEDFEATFEDAPFADQIRRDRVREAEAAVRSDPRNIGRWLEYSTLHLEDASRRATSSDPASATVALSILDKALAAHTANATSSALHLAYFRHAGVFWSASRIADRWLHVLRSFPLTRDGRLQDQSLPIWLGYLDWGEGEGLGYLELRDDKGIWAVARVYRQVVTELRELLLSKPQSGEQGVQEVLLYFFLRHALFQKNSGYTELSYGLMQALVELTFFKPEHLRYPGGPMGRWYENLISSFGRFWERGSARFGEDGARGWAFSEATPFRKDEGARDALGTQESQDWYSRETAEERHFLPRRLDMAIEEDPHRLVVFDDVEALLFPLNSPEVRMQAVYALLHFLGLTVVPPDQSTTSPFTSDVYLQSSTYSNASRRSQIWPARGVRSLPWGEQTSRVETGECPIKAWISDARTLLASPNWFSDVSLEDLGDSRDFVRNAMGLMRPLVPDPRFTMTCIAAQAAVSVKSAMSLSKDILRLDDANLLLWDAYARLERLRGRISAARNVYYTALAAAMQRDPEAASEDEMDVWAALVEMEVELGESDLLKVAFQVASSRDVATATRAANSGFDKSEWSALSRLRAKQWASALSTESTSQLYIRSIFMAYIDENTEAACDTYEASLSAVGSDDEALRQQYAYFLLHLPIKPHLRLRNLINQSIIRYPSNSLFLGLSVHVQRSSRDVLQLLSAIDERQSSTLLNSLWAVWAAGATDGAIFWDKGSVTRERIRTILDRIVTSDSMSRSAAAWLLYIDFECQTSPAKAKSLCYRAIAHVGPSKAIFMLPFSPSLVAHFTKRELYDWSQVMLHRGIRVRIPIPIDSVALSLANALPDDEDLMDDELAFLREQEASKPY